MTPTMKQTVKTAATALAVALASCSSLFGQTAPAADDQPIELSTFVVTGSNIPTAADRTDVPVTVLGKKDIQQSGLSADVLDILRSRMPEVAGRSNAGKSNATNRNQFTAGGSQLSLRNLATLVLLNGRRMATSGINAAGGLNFVDVSQIPTAAIDHIEVLTDGASAIYGSDAVGGVVNVILKSDYQGAEIGGRYAVTNNTGRYSERSGYIIAGGGTKGVNLTITGSWSKTDPLWQSQRPFIAYNPRSGTALPGYVSGNFLSPTLATPKTTNPTGTAATAANIAALVANGTYLASGSTSIPAFNAAPYETLLLGQTQKAAVANLTVDIVPKKLAVFADLEITQTNGFDQDSNFLGNSATSGGAVATQFTIAPIPAGSPYNPIAGAVSGVIIQAPDLPVYNLFQTKGLRGTLGFKGEINDKWSWEVGGTHNDNKTNVQIVNQLFAPNLNAAIAGGYDASGNAVAGGAYSKVATIGSYASGSPQYVYQPALDPFARSGRNPASLANVYGTELIQTESKLDTYDLKVVGTPWDLPGGKLGMAAGAAWRKETLTGTPDSSAYNLSTSAIRHNWGSSGIFFDPWSKSRTTKAYFGELRIPLTGEKATLPMLHNVELSLAMRYENYSDAGNSDSPKVGLRWQPFDDQFTVRGTYSKAFTVPDLFHEYGPPFATLTSGNSFLSNNTLSPAGAINPAFIGMAYYSGNGNNPSLQPAYAWSRSVGFSASPKAIKGLTLGVDYVNIFQKGLPAGLGASTIIQSVNTLGSASPFFSQLGLGALPGSSGANNAAISAPYGLYNLLASGTYQGNLYVLDRFVNSGGTHETMYDFNIEYQRAVASAGTFTVGTTGTYLQSFLYAVLPNAPFYEYAGYSTNGQTMSGTFPHWSFYSTLEWSKGDWDLLVANNYMSAMIDIPSGQIPNPYLSTHPATKVESYTTWDLQIAYTLSKQTAGHLWAFLQGMGITVGMKNAFNHFGPLAPLSQAANINNNNVDTGAYSPIGRLTYVSARIKF